MRLKIICAKIAKNGIPDIKFIRKYRIASIENAT